MKILRLLSVILTVVVVTAGMILFFTSTDKFDKPVLECSAQDEINVKVGVTNEELLSFVKAYDKQDGDITDKIKVTRKNFFVDKKTTIVSYAVADSDNNVTVLEKKLRFDDYVPPRFTFTSDFTFPKGSNNVLSRYVTVQDMIDGDLTNHVKVISNNVSLNSDSYSVNIKVSNSMTDTAEITITAKNTSEDLFNIKVLLKNYICYTQVGVEPDYNGLIETLYDNTNSKYSLNDVSVDTSSVNLNEPGVYEAYYRIFKGNKVVAETRLFVVVEE